MAVERADSDERLSTPAVGSEDSYEIDLMQRATDRAKPDAATTTSSTIFARPDSHSESVGSFQFGKIQTRTQLNKSHNQPVPLTQQLPLSQPSTGIVSQQVQSIQQAMRQQDTLRHADAHLHVGSVQPAAPTEEDLTMQEQSSEDANLEPPNETLPSSQDTIDYSHEQVNGNSSPGSVQTDHRSAILDLNAHAIERAEIASSPPNLQQDEVQHLQTDHDTVTGSHFYQGQQADLEDADARVDAAYDQFRIRSVQPSHSIRNSVQHQSSLELSSNVAEAQATRATSHAYPSHAADQEMDEALQIVAHTWSKFQSPLLHQNEQLTKELDHAKLTIHNLSEQLQRLQSDTGHHITAHNEQKMTLARMKQTFSRLMSYIQNLGKDVDLLRSDQNNYRRLFENLKKESITLNHTRCQITAKCLAQYFKTKDTLVAMSKVMVDLRIQLAASQSQSQYLLIQLEEKTGLLVEARDELALRQARSESVKKELAQLTSTINSHHKLLEKRIDSVSKDDVLQGIVATAVNELRDTIASHTSPQSVVLQNVNNMMESLTQRLAMFATEAVDKHTQYDHHFTHLKDCVVSSCAELKAQVKHFGQECVSAETTMSNLRADLKKVVIEKDKIAADLIQAMAETKTLQAREHQHASQLMLMNHQQLELKSAAESSQSLLKTISAERDNVTEMLKKSEVEVDKLRTQMQQAGTEQHAMGASWALLETEVTMLRDELERSKAVSGETLEDEKSRHHADITTLHTEISKLKEALTQHESSNVGLVKELANTTRALRDAESERAQLQAANHDLSERHDKFKLDVEKLWKVERQRHENQVLALQQQLQQATIHDTSATSQLLLNTNERSPTPNTVIEDAAKLVFSANSQRDTPRPSSIANTGAKIVRQHLSNDISHARRSMSSSVSSGQVVSSPVPGAKKRQASDVLAKTKKSTKVAKKVTPLARSRITRSMKSKFDQRFEEELSKS